MDKNSIIEYLKLYPNSSSTEIFQGIGEASIATVKRLLSKLIKKNIVISTGKAKATRYSTSPVYEIFMHIDMDEYYRYEIDERDVKTGFNFSLLYEILPNISLFNDEEDEKIRALQDRYIENISIMSATGYKKEIERLSIDLSWKSSQIEGNTYSLLETERLLKEKQTASGKTKDEAVMLLNHKETIDFIVQNPDFLSDLSVTKIEYLHSLLIKDLGMDKNIRRRKVGISGTNYTPLDNEYQIQESMLAMCDIINKKNSVFEKALLALLLLSYIQPFVDGNKRIARIVCNAVLISHKHCPISFRTVDSLEYKKAMLLFYEKNNISNFKRIFIDQYEFAVKTYF